MFLAMIRFNQPGYSCLTVTINLEAFTLVRSLRFNREIGFSSFSLVLNNLLGLKTISQETYP